MTKKTMRAYWILVLVVSAALFAFGYYMLLIGLDRADKLASVVGSFSGVIGLLLAWYGIRTTIRQPQGEPPPKEEPGHTRVPESSAGVQNAISGTVEGAALQGRDFKGPITFHLPGTPEGGTTTKSQQADDL